MCKRGFLERVPFLSPSEYHRRFSLFSGWSSLDRGGYGGSRAHRRVRLQEESRGAGKSWLLHLSSLSLQRFQGSSPSRQDSLRCPHPSFSVFFRVLPELFLSSFPPVSSHSEVPLHRSLRPSLCCRFSSPLTSYSFEDQQPYHQQVSSAPGAPTSFSSAAQAHQSVLSAFSRSLPFLWASSVSSCGSVAWGRLSTSMLSLSPLLLVSPGWWGGGGVHGGCRTTDDEDKLLFIEPPARRDERGRGGQGRDVFGSHTHISGILLGGQRTGEMRSSQTEKTGREGYGKGCDGGGK